MESEAGVFRQLRHRQEIGPAGGAPAELALGVGGGGNISPTFQWALALDTQILLANRHHALPP